MRRCCVPNCSTTAETGLNLHRFPNPKKSMNVFQLWLDAIGLAEIRDMLPETVYANKRVCSEHFEDRCRSRNSRISKNSIPSIRLPEREVDDPANSATDDFSNNFVMVPSAEFAEFHCLKRKRTPSPAKELISTPPKEPPKVIICSNTSPPPKKETFAGGQKVNPCVNISILPKIKTPAERPKAIPCRSISNPPKIKTFADVTLTPSLRVVKITRHVPLALEPEEFFKTAQFTFRGHIAPVFTGFKEDDARSVNFQIIPEYAKYLKSKGVNGVLVNGTSGEGMSLSVKERKDLAEVWSNACKITKQTLMLQVGGAPLPDVLELASHAEKLKADALLCLPELYFKPKTADELIKYLSHVSKAAPKTPLLYYHIPSFTNVNINMPEFLTKADGKIETLAGIKFTSTDLVEGAECLKVCNGKYAIFLGADQILAAAYALGFDSAIATTFNFLPELGETIHKAYTTGQPAVLAALTAQNTLTAHVNHIIKHGTWVTTMKTAMNILSPVKVGTVRAPLEDLTKTQKEEMRSALTKYLNPNTD